MSPLEQRKIDLSKDILLALMSNPTTEPEDYVHNVLVSMRQATKFIEIADKLYDSRVMIIEGV